MKIDSSGLTTADKIARGKRSNDQVTGVEKSSPIESVSYSVTMKRAAASAKEAPFDSEKVEAIRQQIKDGTFKVDAQAVVQGMIESGDLR